MKFIILFTLIACYQASSRGHAQAITLSLKNAPLEKVFTEIRKQSPYRFIYAKEDLAGSRPVSIEVSSATIEQVLETSFREQPFSYSVVENHVIIKRKKEVPPCDSVMAAPPITVRGRILNERGEAIEGVSVKIKGTSRGTSSDANGV
ncbi:MAG TPA: STN and carboxypeptidase regulatory-like domain-containing protein, partial [Flavisolibacter sp.]|nr:STN and carboxypeptidase regulatory-like domain-containing protein [Flavisolibacter sp.]